MFSTSLISHAVNGKMGIAVVAASLGQMCRVKRLKRIVSWHDHALPNRDGSVKGNGYNLITTSLSTGHQKCLALYVTGNSFPFHIFVLLPLGSYRFHACFSNSFHSENLYCQTESSGGSLGSLLRSMLMTWRPFFTLAYHRIILWFFGMKIKRWELGERTSRDSIHLFVEGIFTRLKTARQALRHRTLIGTWTIRSREVRATWRRSGSLMTRPCALKCECDGMWQFAWDVTWYYCNMLQDHVIWLGIHAVVVVNRTV